MDSLPWSRRWFVWLVLVRPLIDMSYFMKDVSPLLSPLYIVAILTPLAVVASVWSRSFPKRMRSVPDALMAGWALLVVFNALAGLAFGVTIQSIEMLLRLTLPIFLYYYLRGFVQSKHDLIGLLSTFLFSTVVVFGQLLYEQLVSPIRNVVETRGFERVEGLFADVNSYAFYMAGALLVSAFFFLDDEGRVSLRRRALKFTAVAILSLVALINMHHAASWAVFAAVIVLLVLHSAGRGRASALLVLTALAVPGYLVLGDEIAERVNSMYERELAVLEGERELQFAFHGRMSRWQRHIDEWDQMPLVAKAFGIALHTEPTPGKVGGGIHNDYLRALFATGWVGLLLYLGFYVVTLLRTFGQPASDRFLVRGVTAIVLLYSVTASPMMSVPLLYFGMTVLAYGALPRAVAARMRTSPRGGGHAARRHLVTGAPSPRHAAFRR